MTNETETAMISLTNAHGLFQVRPELLNKAIAAKGNASITYLRHLVAGSAGYAESDWETALDDCSLIEVLIIWIESGNHPF